MDLFSHANKDSIENQPLAEILRPRKIDDMLGQPKILGEKAPWRRLLESGQIPSLILWGPPGCGKTTFALLLAQKVNAEFITVNAVETGAKALRELGEAGRRRRLEHRRRTLLFVDEIHRLNKSQQDVLLPSVEKGDLILVGATTENPSYEINSALLSRCRILVFERLGEVDLKELASRAAAQYGLRLEQILSSEGLGRLLEFSDGDGRRLINILEVVLNLYRTSAPDTSPGNTAQPRPEAEQAAADPKAQTGPAANALTNDHEHTLDSAKGNEGLSKASLGPNGSVVANPIDSDIDTDTDADTDADTHTDKENGTNSQGVVEEPFSETVLGSAEDGRAIYRWPLSAEDLALVVDAPALRYDKTADEHYDTISAFIKSVRGSDPDAGVYYLARMIKGGEDPVFIARRLVILASEDIGNADPRALSVAVAGLQAVELVGWPEAAITLAQVTTYLASAPKSNRSYVALQKAQELVEKTGTVPVPLALRSAKTSSMKNLGYGKGYKYSHEGEKGYVRQRFLPEQLGDIHLYEPTDHGFEKTIRQYLAWLKA